MSYTTASTLARVVDHLKKAEEILCAAADTGTPESDLYLRLGDFIAEVEERVNEHHNGEA